MDIAVSQSLNEQRARFPSHQNNSQFVQTMYGERLPVWEWHLRVHIKRAYRLIAAILISEQFFDFLFSPIWMHGYIWSLNQQIEVDMADKSVGFIVRHQLNVVGKKERLIHAIIFCLAVVGILRLIGYHRRNHTIWELWILSLTCGGASGLARAVQFRSRLLAIIHETFYVYIHFFIVAFCMTIRLGDDDAAAPFNFLTIGSIFRKLLNKLYKCIKKV